MAAVMTMASPAKITLTPDQNAALEQLLRWIAQGKNCALHGPAGTGKTTLTRELYKRLRGMRPVFASPTHKAAGVLRDVLPDGSEVKTVASILQLKPAMRGKRIVFLPDNRSRDSLNPFCGVLVVDEASMISRFLGDQLEELCRKRRIPLLMIGDAAQLPPVDVKPDADDPEEVEQGDPDAKHHSDAAPQFTNPKGRVARLTKVVRHQGPVLALATAIRQVENGMEGVNWLWPTRHHNDDDSIIRTYAQPTEWLKAAAKLICTSAWDDNPDSARILTWSNRQCHSLGAAIRNQRYGRHALQWQVGEILCNGDAIQQPAKSLAAPLAPAAGEWRVLRATTTRLNHCGASIKWKTPARELPRTLDLSIEAEVAVLRLEPLHGGGAGPITVNAELPGQRAWGDQLREMAAAIKAANLTAHQRKQAWKEWHTAKSMAADLRPGAVLTVHRSQGSTFGQVFVAGDLTWCESKEAMALHYVAATRAKTALHVICRR